MNLAQKVILKPIGATYTLPAVGKPNRISGSGFSSTTPKLYMVIGPTKYGGDLANIFEKELEKNSVFTDRNFISPHYVPDKLPFRDSQIRDITTILSPILHGRKADNLFLYGKTGTGKTSVTKHITGQLEAFASSKNLGIECAYVNCRNHNSKYRCLIKAVHRFFPDENFLGYSASFIYDKLLEKAGAGKNLVLILDEIDKVKDVDDLVYALTRANDELGKGSINLIGISNNLLFKDRLDPRTKSSLCEKEMVFPPYNAEELSAILGERARLAFRKGSVEESAISLASAYAAQESGDARTAVMLLLRAGELSDKKSLSKVTDREVEGAKSKVEEEIILNMISTLPEQQQLVLYSIASLTLRKRPAMRRITGEEVEGVLYSGEVYDEYCVSAKKYKESVVSARWYRQYINELEMYGLIVTTASGKGVKGQTRFIKLGFDAEKIFSLLESGFGFSS